MNEENFEQQELFEQKKYISDLVEESSQKSKSSVNIIFGTSIIKTIITLSSYTMSLIHISEPTRK